MLPKKRRIPRELFPQILSGGKRYNSPHLLLSVVGGGSEPSRFSFSVSKKVAKSAVDRNRMRRQGYANVSRHLSAIQSGYLCFFSFKKGSGGITFATLEKEVSDLLKSASVVR